MCGISGYINFKDGINNKVLKNMNNKVSYRGPDDEGYYLEGKSSSCFAFGEDSVDEIKNTQENINKLADSFYLGLGHRRLSILDISENGHQPMESSDGNFIIVYNGEIYNYLELKREMGKRGIQFHTNCDTEVILNAYQLWGKDCVKRFNGMWAFAIWDKVKKTLFCSRDRFGIKPFYYYFDNNKLLFGSEIKQIFEDYSIKKTVNEKEIYAFLYDKPRDICHQTFFENIYPLPASHNIIFKVEDNHIKEPTIERYWSLVKKDIGNKEYSAVKTKLKELLSNSVRIRLRSDVKVGSCLSGGLDSSTVVALACDNLKNEYNSKHKEFETFTSSFDQYKEIDETKYSSKVAKHVGCNENYIYPKKEILLKEIKRLVFHYDEPVPGLSMFVQWCVMKGASEKKVKVLLDGQGGDEVYLGYTRYYGLYLKLILNKCGFNKFFRECKLAEENSSLTLKQVIRSWIKNSFKILDTLNLYITHKDYINLTYFNQKITKKDRKKYKLRKCRAIEELQIEELFYTNLPYLLHSEDRNSMAHSIETRTPFLDYKLVEYVYSIPFEYKIKNGWTKYILRDCIKDEIPKEISWRKNKLGFPAPQKEYEEALIKEFNNLLDNPRSSKYFNMNKISKNFIDKVLNSVEDSRFCWKFISLELWMREFDLQ